MKLLPFGAKSPSNTVVGVAVNADGNLITNKKWTGKYLRILPSIELRDTTVRDTKDIECHCYEYALTSLRINNQTDANIQLTFLKDVDSTSTDWMKDFNNNYVQFVVGQGYTIITPDDVPVLKYISYLKLRYQAESTPTKGYLTIDVLTKG